MRKHIAITGGIATAAAIAITGSLVGLTSAPATHTERASYSQAQAAATIPPSLRGVNVTKIPTQQKIVALTFDGGGDATGVASIRATLREKKVPATFFLTGDFVRSFPVKSQRLGVTGRLGNHSNTHPNFTTIGDVKGRAQVVNAQKVIIGTTGEDPRPLFRFPFGAYASSDIKLVNNLGYIPVGWTVDTLGWKGTTGGMTKAKVVDRVLAGLQPGEIVLMHLGAHPKDGTTLDAAALPSIIDKVRARILLRYPQRPVPLTPRRALRRNPSRPHRSAGAVWAEFGFLAEPSPSTTGEGLVVVLVV